MNRYKPFFEKQDDIKIGDIIKFGKYKNKTATVIGFGTDKNNQPTVITDKGEMSLYHVRIDKLMKEDEDFQLSITPTSNGKFGIWDYVGKQRVYKKGTTSPAYFSSIEDAKKYAMIYMDKKYGKRNWKFEESISYHPFMNRETFDLFHKYKNEWVSASTWESFVKKNSNIFSQEVRELRNTLLSISNEIIRKKKYISEMKQLEFLLTDIWKNLKNNKDLIEDFNTSNKLMKEEKHKVELFTRFIEDVHFSDLMKSQSIGTFTKKYAKETNKLMGNATNHIKLIQMKYSKKKDFVIFFFVTERTPKYDDNFHLQAADPKDNFKLKKDNLYTIQIKILNFFSLLDTTPDKVTNKDIEDVFNVAAIQWYSDVPFFHWGGCNWALSLLDGSIYPTTIAPKFWQKYTNNDSFLDKHSANLANSIKFYIPQMRQMVHKIATKKQTNK